MSIKINYLTLINDEQNEIGQIEYFDTYIPPSKNFPYFFMDQKSSTILHNNWPDLTNFLYLQKIEIVEANKTTINSFSISSFTNTSNSIATLNFTDSNSVLVLKGLLEDRQAYFLENGNYVGWNKTFTPLSNISNGTINFFIKDANYYITNITIINDNNANFTANSLSTTVISTPFNLNTSIKLEFGLYRIPNQSSSQSVYYSGIKGRFIANNNTSISLTGLKRRSQIIGHTHEHIHDMNNHTHTMPHTHDLSNHVHYMNHVHNYLDYRSDASGVSYVPNIFTDGSAAKPPYDTYRVTNYTRDFTDGPKPNITGQANNSTTSVPSNNVTSNIQSRTTDIDDVYSNNNNFKVNNKILPETYTVYQYMYGKTYYS